MKTDSFYRVPVCTSLARIKDCSCRKGVVLTASIVSVLLAILQSYGQSVDAIMLLDEVNLLIGRL